jgi:hypothetical protein
VATFSDLNIDEADAGYTLTAAATGLTGATSSAFTISPAAANNLAFTVQPSNAVAGVNLSPAVQVTIRDQFGNTVTSATNDVTVALGTNPGGDGVLDGTLTVAAVAGIATFSDLNIDEADAGYTLTAAATGLTGATSSAFNITAAAASQLAFTVQPSDEVAGVDITPAVEVTIQDQFGNPVTTATNDVTVALGNNPGGDGVLDGTLTVAAVAGIATFSDLNIDEVDTGYTLTASATGLTGASSSAFNITAVGFRTEPAPSLVNAGSAGPRPRTEMSIDPRLITLRVRRPGGIRDPFDVTTGT